MNVEAFEVVRFELVLAFALPGQRSVDLDGDDYENRHRQPNDDEHRRGNGRVLIGIPNRLIVAIEASLIGLDEFVEYRQRDGHS